VDLEASKLGILNSRPSNKQIKRFRDHSFGWLIEMLASSPRSTFMGCELNMNETALMKDGRASLIVKTNKDGILEPTAKNLPVMKFLQHMSGALQDRSKLICRKRRDLRKK
jgi:hypothetical protein